MTGPPEGASARSAQRRGGAERPDRPPGPLALRLSIRSLLGPRDPGATAFHRLADAAYKFLVVVKWEIAGAGAAGVPYFSSRAGLIDEATSRAGLEGLWLEFGVWQGQSINRISERTPGVVYGFDSFEGLPETWARGFEKGVFSLDGRLPAVGPNVVLIKGWFSETLPTFLATHPGPASFVHIDCDLYSSARLVLSGLSGRIVPGTVLLFDEFITGFRPDDEARAFREFLRAAQFSFRYLGSSESGSVAVQISPAPDR